MTLTILRGTDQVFCKLSLDWDSFGVFSVLWGLGFQKEDTGVQCPSHHVVSRVWTWPGKLSWCQLCLPAEAGLPPLSNGVILFPVPTLSSLGASAQSPHLVCVGLRGKDWHRLIWNFPTQIYLFFPTYWLNHWFTSGWLLAIHLTCWVIIQCHFIAFVAQILSALVTGSSSSWLLCPSAMSPPMCACACARVYARVCACVCTCAWAACLYLPP